MSEWRPIKWTCADDRESLRNHGVTDIAIERVISPFYEGERFAVRRMNECMSVDGVWEYESLPSSRDDEFYRRFRFPTFEAARDAILKAEANP